MRDRMISCQLTPENMRKERDTIMQILSSNKYDNQFISFSINPLQGVHHVDIEMVEKYIYKIRSDLYNFQCHTLYKKQFIKYLKIEENYYIGSFYNNKIYIERGMEESLDGQTISYMNLHTCSRS
jgi:hypothetical protein